VNGGCESLFRAISSVYHMGRKSRSNAQPQRARLWLGALLAAGLSILLAIVFIRPALIGALHPAQRSQPVVASSEPSLMSWPGASALSRFSAAHNASLLWGTYRPGVYFGLRSRTAPTALVAGLMWTSARPDGTPERSTLRHQCEQDGLERYGFSAHDGRGFGAQPISDPANGVVLTTSFVSEADGGWAVRIAGAPTGPPMDQHVFLYVAVDSEFADALADGGALDSAPRLPFQPPDAVHARGSLPALGAFSLLAEARRPDGGAPLPVRMWGSATRGHSHLSVAETVLAFVGFVAPESRRGAQGGHPGKANKKQPTGDLEDKVAGGSRLLVFQLRSGGEAFELDLTYVPGGCGGSGGGGGGGSGGSGGGGGGGQKRGGGRAEGGGSGSGGGGATDAVCSEAHRRWSGAALGAELSGREAAFSARLVKTFGLQRPAAPECGAYTHIYVYI